MKAIILILGLIVYANCELGAVTYCGNIFIKEVPNLNALKSTILLKCQELLDKNSLTEDNGCLQCNSRYVYNLFPYEQKLVTLSFCIGSTLTCQTKYTGKMNQLFNSFMNLINTSEKLSALFEKEIQLNKTTIDKDEAPAAKAIKGTIIRHTSTSLTYEISTELDSPIKCFKTLTSTNTSTEPEPEPEFPTGSTYYILQPRTSKRVFTESFTASSYDCQTYKFYLKCVPLPYQENVSTSTTIKLFEVKHKIESTICKAVYPIDPVPPASSQEKESLPTMKSEDPMVVDEEEIEVFRGFPLEEKEQYMQSIGTFENKTGFIEKMNEIIHANKILEAVGCESENCEEQKRQIQNNCWKSIKNEIEKDNKTIIDSLDAKEGGFEKNTKILFQTMIVSFGNDGSFQKELAQDAISISSKALSLCNEIIQKIDNKNDESKEAIKEDLLNLMVSAGSSMFQIANALKKTNNEETLVTKQEEVKEVQKSIDNVAKCLILNQENEKKTVNFNFSFNLITNSTLRRLDENFYEYKYPEEGIEIMVPKEYGNKLEPNTGIKIISFKSYPFITQAGSKYFSNRAVSVEFVNGQDGTIVNSTEIDKNAKIEVLFNNDIIDSSFKTCYMFNDTSDNEPSTEKVTVDTSKEGYIGCQMSKTGDVLVGNYNKKQSGLPGYAIFLIVFSVLVVLGVSGFLVWKFIIQKKLEKDKMMSLNETPREMGVIN